jgi:methionine synthase II (cobalamin-independent)
MEKFFDRVDLLAFIEKPSVLKEFKEIIYSQVVFLYKVDITTIKLENLQELQALIVKMRNKIDNLHSEKYPPSVREFALKFEDNK